VLRKEKEPITRLNYKHKKNRITELERKYNNLELAKAVSDSSGEHETARKKY
jgi:hypothetical protein